VRRWEPPRTNLGGGPQGDHVGRVFVVFGQPDLAAIDLADCDSGDVLGPDLGQAFTGEFMGDHAGTAITSAERGEYSGRAELVSGAAVLCE